MYKWLCNNRKNIVFNTPKNTWNNILGLKQKGFFYENLLEGRGRNFNFLCSGSRSFSLFATGTSP